MNCPKCGYDRLPEGARFCPDAAISRLADARTAATSTDPLDPQALALRGYILGK